MADEFAACDQPAMGRHDAGVGPYQSGEFFVSADAAPVPGAIAEIQKRPLIAGHGSARDQHVQFWKMHIDPGAPNQYSSRGGAAKD